MALRRTAPEGHESILTLTGVTGEAMGLTIPMAAVGSHPYLDLLSGRSYEAQGKSLYLTLPPYGRFLLKGKP